MELYIVLGIMAFMIFGFVLNKWPFGITTMICCVLLVVTGVYGVSDAFSGFSSHIAFTMGARGPLLEKADRYNGVIPEF